MWDLLNTYKPHNFNGIKGQDIPVKLIENSLVQDKIAPAYLFYGPTGVGKNSLAEVFKQELTLKGKDCVIHRNAQSLPKEEVFSYVDKLQTDSCKFIPVFIADGLTQVSPYLKAECLAIPFRAVPLVQIKNHLRNVSRKEGWLFTDGVLGSISNKAGGSMKDALVILGQAAMLNAFERLPECLGFNLDSLYEKIWLSLDDPTVLESTVDEVLACVSAKDLYDELARLALESYLVKELNPMKQKYDKKLLAFAQTITNHRRDNVSRNSIVCDLLMLDGVIADGGKVKNFGFKPPKVGNHLDYQSHLVKQNHVGSGNGNGNGNGHREETIVESDNGGSSGGAVQEEQEIVLKHGPKIDYVSSSDLAALLGADLIC